MACLSLIYLLAQLVLELAHVFKCLKVWRPRGHKDVTSAEDDDGWP